MLATARLDRSRGQPARTSTTRSARLRPDADVVLLLEPYGYGLRGRSSATSPGWSAASYHVRTVAAGGRRQRLAAGPRRAAPAGDDGRPGVARDRRAEAVRRRHGRCRLDEPERTFLHRHYDWVVALRRAGRASRGRGRCGRRSSGCSPLGTPRTDRSVRHGGARRGEVAAARGPPVAAGPPGRAVRADVPRPRARQARHGGARRRRGCGQLLPADVALVLKTHPNLDPADPADGRVRRRRRSARATSTTGWRWPTCW